MAKINLPLATASLLCACLTSACAAQLNSSAFSTWIETLERDAIADGVSPATVHAALDSAMVDERIVELDQKQPESTATFASYVQRIVSPDRVEQGRQFIAQYRNVLKDVSDQYGVPPEVIVALWSVESHFGQNKGKYHIVDSLVTLAYQGRRADFFRKELIDALHILDQEHIPASALRGSWAGAMGQCQFMPSTYLRYAVDYTHSGQRDIWNNTSDVFASIANYLAAEGWHGGQSWGQEVKLTNAVASGEVGLEHKKTLQEWVDEGVTTIDGSAFGDKTAEASLVQPDGADGRSFLVFDNYRAVMRWNRSTYFATAVGLLADRMK